MPAGRPRKHDRAVLVRAICKDVAGGELVKDVCARSGITAGQLREWVAADAELSALYARAREDQAHSLAEIALTVATGDDAITQAREEAIEAEADSLAGRPGWQKRIAVLETNVIARDKLRVDALKWMASKIAPRLYGEKISQEISGPDGGPVQVEQQVWTFGDKTVAF